MLTINSTIILIFGCLISILPMIVFVVKRHIKERKKRAKRAEFYALAEKVGAPPTGILALPSIQENDDLLIVLRDVKAVPKMYFGQSPTVTDLLNFFMGYRSAIEGDPTLYGYVSYIAKLKQTGSNIPNHNDITFDEALEVLINLCETSEWPKCRHCKERVETRNGYCDECLARL